MTAPATGMPETVSQTGRLRARSAQAMSNAAARASVTARWDECLMYVSMALLLISTSHGIGLIGDGVKVVWLVSVALLTVLNAGAAFGVTIAGVAVFSVLHFPGVDPLLSRPHTYALSILNVGLAVRMVVSRLAWTWDRSTLMIAAFLGYVLLHTVAMGLLTGSVFAIYVWMHALPMLMFLLLAKYAFSLRELRALARSLLVLGAYMALVSIAERAGLHDLIVPAWIVDPSLTSILPGLGPSYPRAGGILMQPAWNGLALSLIYCVAIFSPRLLGGNGRLGRVVGLLCLVGVFFSDTRAAWLGCALASLVLLWRPSATHARTQLKRFGLVVASAVCTLALVTLPESSARQRIDDAGTVFYRLNLWKAALSMAADRPVLGSGLTTFDNQVPEYRHEMTVGCGVSGKIRCLGGRMNIDEDAAHNTLLSIVVELGAVGLLLYGGAFVAIFQRARRTALRVWGREGALWVGMFAGTYFLQAQFAVAHEPTTNLILFGVLGAIAGLLHHAPAGPRAVMPMLDLSARAHGSLNLR